MKQVRDCASIAWAGVLIPIFCRELVLSIHETIVVKLGIATLERGAELANSNDPTFAAQGYRRGVPIRVI